MTSLTESVELIQLVHWQRKSKPQKSGSSGYDSTESHQSCYLPNFTELGIYGLQILKHP
jgi:hypothetical protein